MSDEDLVRKAWGRVAQCRRLAAMVTDPHTEAMLRQMADEAEADIRTFQARQAGALKGSATPDGE